MGEKGDRQQGVVTAGVVLGDYSVEAQLGRGGMAEVFRARDHRLDRLVALKVLPAEFLHDPERRQRFQREAKALAALNHPNIVTVFSVEESRPRHPEAAPGEVDEAVEPLCFMTMELVDGGTLFRSIPSGGMELDRFFELAVPLSDALAAAHEKGIIHRDLKPANIVIGSDGRPRILDFGLAKTTGEVSGQEATAAPTVSLETRAGAVMGTVGYMSPEQVRGEQVDARSDVFSLGLVLYEMASGRRAFDASTGPDLMSAILRDSPVSPDQIRPDLPHHLARVIRRCLEKDPERRYQSAKDVRNELEDLARELETEVILQDHSAAKQQLDRGLWAHRARILGVVLTLAIGCVVGYLMVRRAVDGPPGVEKPKIQSLAVLPLDNLMNDPEQEYFVEGMHEALITDLSRISALRVISRTSAMLYANSSKSVPEIAAELGVDALVEGSVLRADNRVRITAQLIDGHSDQHLWAQSYDRELENVLALLSEVAQGIAQEIEITLTAEQQQHFASSPTVDPAVQELVLKGMYHFNSGRFEDFAKALDFQQQAVELDPSFAPAWASLSGSYLIHGFFGLAPAEEMIPRAVSAAKRALELDAAQGVAHTVLGYVALFFDWDWETAESELLLAIKLAPSDVMAYHGYADYLFVMGDCEASIEQVRLGRQYDPMGGWANSFVTGHLALCGHFEEAIEEGQRSLESGIVDSPIGYYMGLSHWLLGRYEQALARWRTEYGTDSAWYRTVEQGYAEDGPAGAMLALAEATVATNSKSRNPYVGAGYFAMAGELDEAFRWLDQAYIARTPQLLHMTFDPRLDAVRDDPRFSELLLRIGIPESPN